MGREFCFPEGAEFGAQQGNAGRRNGPQEWNLPGATRLEEGVDPATRLTLRFSPSQKFAEEV